MSDKDQFTFDEDDDAPKRPSPEVEESESSELSYEDFSAGFAEEDETDGASLNSEESFVAVVDNDEDAESFLSYEDNVEDDTVVESLAAESEERTSAFEEEASPAVDFGDDGNEPELSLGYGDHMAGDDGSDDMAAAFDEEDPDSEPVYQEVVETKSDDNSRSRILLLILLLVAAVAGGAYYFMDLGGTTPAVPTTPVPVATNKTTVSLPPSDKAPATTTKDDVPAKPVTVSVPVPPPAISSEKDQAVKAVEPPEQEEDHQAAVPVEEVSPQKVTAADALDAREEQSETAPPAAKINVAVPTTQATVGTAEINQSLQPAAQAQEGVFALDAGSYLLESNRDNLIAKIKTIGYEPLVTPVDATLSMIRLRLGTYSKEDVQEALSFARTIEPGAYSAPAGDRFVIYAGTFLNSKHVETVSQKFAAEGIKVFPEPVEVVRTLSRIRFGSFATMEDAQSAAQDADRAGVKAVAVKSK